MVKENEDTQYEMINGNKRSKFQIFVSSKGEVFMSGLPVLTVIMLMQDKQPCYTFGRREAFKVGTLVEANGKCYLVPDSVDYFHFIPPSEFCLINGKKALEFTYYKPKWKK